MSEHQYDSTPVFPLPLVAFPGEPILLHIFEPRYQEMVAICRERSARGECGEFVISFLVDDQPSEVATTVQIEKVIKEYDDGRLDLLAKGKRRVRIATWKEGAPYRQAEISHHPDNHTDWDEALATRVYRRYCDVIKLVTGENPVGEDFSGKPVLSYYLIPTCGLSVTEHQHLLEIRSENDRLVFIDAHLGNLLEHVPPILDAIRSIHTNWHVRTEFS